MANPNPDTSGLRPVKKGDPPRNPAGNNGYTRRKRAQQALFKLFGEDKLDEWINRALVAKGLDMDEIAQKKPNGKPRNPDLAALLALAEWAYGKAPTPKPQDDADELDEAQPLDEHGNPINP